jgi:hypothetical protein
VPYRGAGVGASAGERKPKLTSWGSGASVLTSLPQTGWARHLQQSLTIRSACQPAPPGPGCGCWGAGIGELAGDGLRLVAPVISILPHIVELTT